MKPIILTEKQLLDTALKLKADGRKFINTESENR